MVVKIGDSLPGGTLWELERKPGGGPKEYSVRDLCVSKRIVIFGLPGAFTPTCSASHLPGFVIHSDEILNHVDEIWCLSVNDAFVMDAWGLDQNVEDKVMMLADGSGYFTKAIGQELDRMEAGMGMRSARYAMIVDDGLVTEMLCEEPGAFEVSSAEYVLTKL